MSVADTNASIPANVNRIIKDQGLKQKAVAHWAGLSTRQFNDMLNGRRVIKPCDVVAIARALSVSVSDLFQPQPDESTGAAL